MYSVRLLYDSCTRASVTEDNEFVVKQDGVHLIMWLNICVSPHVWQRLGRSSAKSIAQALTDGRVFAVRKSMQLDLGLPDTFIRPDRRGGRRQLNVQLVIAAPEIKVGRWKRCCSWETRRTANHSCFHLVVIFLINPLMLWFMKSKKSVAKV